MKPFDNMPSTSRFYTGAKLYNKKQ